MGHCKDCKHLHNVDDLMYCERLAMGLDCGIKLFPPISFGCVWFEQKPTGPWHVYNDVLRVECLDGTVFVSLVDHLSPAERIELVDDLNEFWRLRVMRGNSDE